MQSSNKVHSSQPSIQNAAPTTEPLIQPSLVARLRAVEGLIVQEQLDLSQLSRWKIGGVADCVVCPRSASALQQAIQLAREASVPVTVIGLTTNLLFAQEGVRALVIHLGAQFAGMRIEGNRVWGQAGLWVPGFARRVARAGLSGVEHLAGIPGTLGGLICMNGGSQRKGIGDHLVSVKAVDSEGRMHTYDHAQCGFAYRTSIFQTNNQIITEAEFEYETTSDRVTIRREMKRILADRRRKFPQKQPNCGSVFVSNPALYASFGPPGAVIERCGLKGTVRGGAEISPLHANFIVNRGDASTEDVLYLIDLVRSTVQRETGCDLEAEAKYVNPLGQFSPAHQMARQWAQENLA